MLNIVIPMAGRGSRFANEGYSDPKPLIRVRGKPMIARVIENLRPRRAHRFIFLCLVDQIEKYDLFTKLSNWAPRCVVIPIDKVTEGAACTVLLAKQHINTVDPLMIANSDQWIDFDINTYLAALDSSDFDGLIMTMTAQDSKWSFIGFDSDGKINRVVEKEVISSEATVGIYNFRAGGEFVTAAEEMIARNLRVNGEFYVAPTYNILLERQKKIGYFNIGSERNGMYGLGTPSDLEYFQKLNLLPEESE